MTQDKAKDDRELLEALVDRINATIKNSRQLLDQRLDDRRFSRAADQRRLPKVVREIINDAADAGQEWADYDRQRIGVWLGLLSTGKSLPPDDLEELTDIVNRDVVFMSRMELQGGMPTLTTTPQQFKSAVSEAAYALLKLAVPKRGGFRVTSCKVCGLIMLEAGKTKRRQFCSKTHQDRFGKAQQRKRERVVMKLKSKTTSRRHK